MMDRSRIILQNPPDDPDFIIVWGGLMTDDRDSLLGIHSSVPVPVVRYGTDLSFIAVLGIIIGGW